MRRALLLGLAVLVGPVFVLGLALTPVAILRQLCYRASAYALIRFKYGWRDVRPVDVETPNRRARRAAASHRGGVGSSYRGLR